MRTNFKYKHIIWDYNGTLLDDVGVCVDCMNILLKKYLNKQLTVEKYKEIFDFPVKKYYEKAGFDFSKYDFKIIGHEFIDLYHEKHNQLVLKNNSVKILNFFSKKKIKQSILSAREQNKLIYELKNFGIFDFFENISGLDNHLAASKEENGKFLIEKINIPKSEIVIIGDTIHDYEVAKSIGIGCILISDGHQSKAKLEKVTANIYENLDNFLAAF